MLSKTNGTHRIRVMKMTRNELDAVAHIDRSERVIGTYRSDAGTLTANDLIHEIPDWTQAKREQYIERARIVQHRGGTGFGAWDGERLVGFALVDPDGVPSNPALIQLDLLHVSAQYRGQGIARLLVDSVVLLARDLNAEGIYISATPTRNTVDLYLHFGATLCYQPDPDLLGKEPDDIHLVLWLSNYHVAAGSERAG